MHFWVTPRQPCGFRRLARAVHVDGTSGPRGERIRRDEGEAAMRTGMLATVVFGVALTLGASGGCIAAQTYEFESAPTTVLTMASNGAWGAATDDSVGTAIAGAIAHCNRRQRGPIGCGASYTTIRAGWSLGIRCGGQNILVAEKTLVEAEQAAIDREIALRRHYVADMPPCVRVVSVDPSGTIIAPYAADLVRMVMQRRDEAAR